MAILRELATVSELAGHRDWILHLIHDGAVRDVDIDGWTPEDVRSFVIGHETDPKTARDLFRIVVNRLSDIKGAVESSDNSWREEVPFKAKEYVLRRWLARKLTDRSRQRYTVPQEEEIDQEQRPDLRVENPKTSPVSIEIKWAENWTIAELLYGLEVQLVGQYLKANGSRHGIFLLAADGRKETWKTEEGNRLTFPEVTQLLEKRAEELTAKASAFDDLRVVSIDFRVPERS